MWRSHSDAIVVEMCLMEMKENQMAQALADREAFRDRYRRQKDPIAEGRLLWRAQTVRHLVHLLPEQTILELAAGDGLFAKQLADVSHDENPITAVTYR